MNSQLWAASEETHSHPGWPWGRSVSVCVCVCEREREREREPTNECVFVCALGALSVCLSVRQTE